MARKRDENSVPLRVYKEDDYWLIDHPDTSILTRANWLEIRTKIDAFYAKFSDTSIEEYNEQVRKDVEAAIEESAVESSEDDEGPIPGFVYLIHGEGTHWYKIGISDKPNIRVQQLGTQGPFPHKILHTFAVDDMYGVEWALHTHFAAKRAGGEWFTLDANDITWIMQLKCRGVKALHDVLAATVAA